MRDKLKLNVYSIYGVMLFVLIFVGGLSNLFKYGLIITIGLFLFSKVSVQLLRKYQSINLIFILFIIISLIISYNARGITQRDPFLANIVYGVIITEFLLYIEIITERCYFTKFIRLMYYCLFFLIIIVDISAFTVGGNDRLYLVGTKFAVAYIHLYLITFFMAYNNNILRNKYSYGYYKTWMEFLALIGLTFIVSKQVDCLTGMVGSVILLVIRYAVKKFKLASNSTFFFVAIILISFGGMWGIEALLLNDDISKFVSVYLNKDITLTGRTEIYAAIPKIMKNHWLFGYGYGTSYEICLKEIGYANTQNALMEYILQFGLIGTFFWVWAMSYCFAKVKYIIDDGGELNNWFIALIYTFIIIGIIEITYDVRFMALLILLYGIYSSSKKERS